MKSFEGKAVLVTVLVTPSESEFMLTQLGLAARDERRIAEREPERAERLDQG